MNESQNAPQEEPPRFGPHDLLGFHKVMSTGDAPTSEAYLDAFLAINLQMTKTRRKLLRTHYRAFNHQATMSQIAEAMGWRSYSSANVHYGRLALLVGKQTGFHFHDCYLRTLCTFLEPEEFGDHWLIIMRPQVAEALEQLEWV